MQAKRRSLTNPLYSWGYQLESTLYFGMRNAAFVTSGITGTAVMLLQIEASSDFSQSSHEPWEHNDTSSVWVLVLKSCPPESKSRTSHTYRNGGAGWEGTVYFGFRALGGHPQMSKSVLHLRASSEEQTCRQHS